MDYKNIIDNITKYVGDYIATHANRNELLTSYDSVNKIDEAIKNIDNTLNSIDDSELSDKLKDYKKKKEEEKRTIINDLMYKVLPKQPVIDMDDYVKIQDDKGEHLILKNVDDSFIDPLFPSKLTAVKQKGKKKTVTKTTKEYYEDYSGGCGSPRSERVSSYSGGCGNTYGSSWYHSGGC